MRATIDRFEGDFAVCETECREMVNIELYKIPTEAKEGDVLQIGESIVIDKSETQKRKAKIEKLVDELWQ